MFVAINLNDETTECNQTRFSSKRKRREKNFLDSSSARKYDSVGGGATEMARGKKNVLSNEKKWIEERKNKKKQHENCYK